MRIYPTKLFLDKQSFLYYNYSHNQLYRPNTHSQKEYKKLIKSYRSTNDYKQLLINTDHIKLIYSTLKEWNMDQRGAKLVSFSKFRKSILDNSDAIIKLHSVRIEAVQENQLYTVLNDLKHLFISLEVMETKARIVGVSKTLHFLLPDLVMPIDRNNILDFLYLSKRYSSDPEKEFKVFQEIFIEYNRLSRQLSLSASDVDNKAWNTSIPKMIDNAVIGFLSALLAGSLLTASN